MAIKNTSNSLRTRTLSGQTSLRLPSERHYGLIGRYEQSSAGVFVLEELAELSLTSIGKEYRCGVFDGEQVGECALRNGCFSSFRHILTREDELVD